jgi:dTDP-glucose 4,6-dehydratase
MASLSHVDHSIVDPIPFINNNVNLALNMLEYARIFRPKIFIQISTDEVYGPAPINHDHKEWEMILPSNPYAASKAAQEAIAISYWRTYGVPVVITNTMNIIGERQDPDKFIPMCISKINSGEKVIIHGSTDFIGSRKYLYARTKADALLFILNNIEPEKYIDDVKNISKPSRFNIVGDIELNNLQVATMIAEIMGKDLDYELVDFHAITTRPGHDRRYSLDGSNLSDRGWKSKLSFCESLQRTVQWYIDNPEWLRIDK